MEKVTYETLNKGSESYSFLRLGKPRNKTIIFFNCLFGEPHFSLRFLNYLSKDFEVIAPKIPLKPTLSEIVDYSIKFASDMSLKDYTVTGVSLGGGISIHHSLRSKEVNSLYPINPIVPSDTNLLKLIFNVRHILYNAFLPWEKGDFPDILIPKYVGSIFYEILENPLTAINLIKDISRYGIFVMLSGTAAIVLGYTDTTILTYSK